MLVALVSDPDGKTGSISVESASGSVTIDTSYQATTTGDAKTQPSAPENIGKEKLDTILKEALSIQPDQPIHFLLYFRQGTSLTLDFVKLLPAIMAAIKERNANEIFR